MELDDDEDPVELSTPTTVSGTPLTSTVWPTGSTPRKSSEAVVAPRSTTGEWSVTSWLSMKRPWARVRPRTVSHLGVEPWTEVVHVLDPAVRVSDDDVIGATDLMSGATVGFESAVTSDIVRVDAVPSAWRMPVLEVELPGEIVSTFDPKAVISEVTWLWAPSPRPTVRMTAAMPMRMPSTVNAERRRWLCTPFSPVRNVSSQLTGCSPRSAGRSR